MDLQLSGRSAIVSGGGSNIGRAIALALAAEGANVAIFDRDAKQADAVARRAAEEFGASVIVVEADITIPDPLRAGVDRVIESFGIPEILVNNAGWAKRSRFLDQEPAEAARLIEVNLIGMMNLTRAVLPHMVDAKRGSVVSISSDAARIGEKQEGAYGAAKAGVIALTKTLAREHGRDGLRFNVVCPGATIPESSADIGEGSLWNQKEYDVYQEANTQSAIAKHYPLGRLGRPSDIAAAVVFLASERASFITGQTLSVDGGYVMP
jgi:2-hydroxycyclohexanecarboxyl-CoA dehydrogenase